MSRLRRISNLKTPPERSSAFGGIGRPSALAQEMIGVGMPDMYRHWNSTLSPLVTVCKSDGYISTVGISLGSISRIELALPDPQVVLTVHTYMPLSLTAADLTLITPPEMDRAGELRSSPTFSQDMSGAEDPDPIHFS